MKLNLSEVYDEETYQHLKSIMQEDNVVVRNKPKPMAKWEGIGDNPFIESVEDETFTHFYASRSCPQCGRELVKRDPTVTVICPCGWSWRG